MDATSPVSTASVPAPASGPAEARPAQDSAPVQAAAPPQGAAPVQASSPVLSTSDAAKVILAQPAVQAPTADVNYNPSPTAQQIQSELSQLLQQLDNQPEEHPNAPAVVLLQNKETALRAALTQVSLGTPGPGQAYLSGVVLNAAV